MVAAGIFSQARRLVNSNQEGFESMGRRVDKGSNDDSQIAHSLQEAGHRVIPSPHTVIAALLARLY